MEDGEVIGPPKFESWRCAYFCCFVSYSTTFRVCASCFRVVFKFVTQNQQCVLKWLVCFESFRVVLRKIVVFKNDPEVSGSGRGASPTYSEPYLIHFGTKYRKSPKIHNYEHPYKNQVNFVAPCRSTLGGGIN